MLPPAADQSEVRGYIFRFLSQLSILAPKLGLGETATVLSCAMLRSLGKNSMCDITCVWKQSGITCLLVDHEALKHLPNVETRFYCPQTFLYLYFQCRDDVSEVR